MTELIDLTPHRCNKHNKLKHDFFISYRVSKDSATAVKLAAFLDGAKRPDGTNFKTYLDRNCLVPGKNWEAGFSYGINNSSSILLLISEGLIATMYNKAKGKEVDNVLKEHKMALDLLAKGKQVIPIFLSTHSVTKSYRECFVKFNDEKALGKFANVASADPEVIHLMRDVQETLQQVFALPSIHVQPESIPEKIPKIVQLWYQRHMQKQNEDTLSGKVESRALSRYSQWVRYPSQSFRLTIFGAILGLVLPIITLSVLFMPSKSRKHTDMKRGVATGNVIAFCVIILICIVMGVNNYNTSTGMWCSQCEAMVDIFDLPSESAYLDIPYMKTYVNECTELTFCQKELDKASLMSNNCLYCLCYKVYTECVVGSSKVYVLVALSVSLVILIIATLLFVSRFTSTESFALVM